MVSVLDTNITHGCGKFQIACAGRLLTHNNPLSRVDGVIFLINEAPTYYQLLTSAPGKY